MENLRLLPVQITQGKQFVFLNVLQLDVLEVRKQDVQVLQTIINMNQIWNM